MTVIVTLFGAGSVAAAGGDFGAEFGQASEKLKDVMPGCEKLMEAGDFSGANAKLLATFPEATRTAAQSFLLANILFDADAKQSYTLHKAAAKAEPQNSNVQWEWALEQHRAGEYAGALASYQAFSMSQPGWAPCYALQADCLLRLNRIDGAVDAWHKSETAPDGTLETMEDLVCTVHREPAPHARRAELLARATQQRDVDAACDLIALDCDFPRDWWNGGPQKAFLRHDLPAVQAALKLPADDVRGRAMACAVECATADRDDPAAIKAILSKHRLLTDADHTLPSHGGLLSLVLGAATRSKAVDEDVLRRQLGPKVLELARKGKDVGAWNAAAFAGPTDKDEELRLEREGWQATGDARFAAGVLFLKQQRGELKGDDADLAAALKQFPESGMIQRAAYETAEHEGKVTRQLLADAAKAEFTHFSSFVAPATVVNRPRSDYLRAYFAQLRLMPQAANQAAPAK
jgi:hypothetical protein